jgi:nucleoside-diphosphate-sugar epimerase
VEKARQGRLRLLGDGSQKIDTTYIANAVEAHGLAAQALLKDGVKAACGGRAYFISNGEPWPIKDVLNAILAAAGQPPVTRSISPRLAYAVGAALEAWYWLMGKQDEPPMTRFVARQLATDHWFDLSAARRDFGYRPVVDLRTGFQRLAEHFQAQGQADPSA